MIRGVVGRLAPQRMLISSAGVPSQPFTCSHCMRLQFSLKSLFVIVLGAAVLTWYVCARYSNFAATESLLKSLEVRGATVIYERPHAMILVRRVLGIEHGPRIVGLEFDNRNIATLDFCKNPLLRHIEILEVHSERLGDREVEVLLLCPELRDLDLRGTGITDESVSVICGLSQLEQVCIGRTAISEAGVRAISRTHPACRIVR